MKYSECPDEIAEALLDLGCKRVSRDEFKLRGVPAYWVNAVVAELTVRPRKRTLDTYLNGDANDE